MTNTNTSNSRDYILGIWVMPIRSRCCLAISTGMVISGNRLPCHVFDIWMLTYEIKKIRNTNQLGWAINQINGTVERKDVVEVKQGENVDL